MSGPAHVFHVLLQLADGVALGEVGIFNVACHFYLAVVVYHYYGYGVVGVQNLQHKVEVGVFIGIVERVHGLGPDGHLVACLLLKVLDQEMGVHQRDGSNHDCCHNEYVLNLLGLVNPCHILVNAFFVCLLCGGMSALLNIVLYDLNDSAADDDDGIGVPAMEYE